MEIISAICLGALFGFVLHRVGASNPQNIINMLRLTDLHLIRAILLGIALASAILFIGLTLGFFDPSHLSVKTSYWGVIIGGVILGVGWALAGYCPGTGVAALGEGRKDAIFFIAGGLVGAWLYMVTYSAFKGMFLLDNILGGKVTLAQTPKESYAVLLDKIPGIIPALIVALVLGVIAWRLPGKTSAD